MTNAEPEDIVTVASDGVTVEKTLKPDDFPVPVISFNIHSVRDTAVSVRLADTVPDGTLMRNIGFHAKYGAEFWNVEDDQIIFIREFAPEESYTTVYGLRGDDAETVTDFMSEPTIESVNPPLSEDGEDVNTKLNVASMLDENNTTSTERDHYEVAEEYMELAEKAQSSGDFDKAIKYYEVVLDRLQQAGEPVEPDSEVSGIVKETQEQLNSIAALREQRVSLKEILQGAERNFQEAVASFVNGTQTVARIRFRQARDEFSTAREKTTYSGEELFLSPIIVDVDPQEELAAGTLETMNQLDETTVERFNEKNIETAADLTHSDGKLTPTAVTALNEADEISAADATVLTVLSWWHDQEEYAFDSAEAISHRYKQAKRGFNDSK